MGTLGMYKEATDILNKINRYFTRTNRLLFYGRSYVYGYMSDYAASPQEKKKYVDLTQSTEIRP
jgi:hypothetical protein